MKPESHSKAILAIAVPAIVANITTPLLGLVDVAITGHMGSAVYIAAIAAGGMMFNMLYWLFGFLRMGTSGMTAQSFGSGDMEQSKSVLLRSIAISVGIGCIIILAHRPLCDGLLRLLYCNAQTADAAREYFLTLVWGAPAVLATYSITGWLLGMQNSRAGMWVSLLVNVVNIAASLALVYGLGMQMRGVALGSLIAQWSGVLAGLGFCLKYRSLLQSRGEQTAGIKASIARVFRGSELMRFFHVNGFIFLRTLCLIAVTMWFTRVGAMQGTVMLAVNALLMQFFTLFSYFLDGFAYAGEALAGKYVGSGSRKSLERVVHTLLGWGIVIATLFSAAYLLMGDQLLALLSDRADVTTVASEYLVWAITVPFVGFGAFVWDGIYIGATATGWMLSAMCISALLFFGLYALLFPHYGNHGLWIAFCSYLAARSVLSYLFWKIRGKTNNP